MKCEGFKLIVLAVVLAVAIAGMHTAANAAELAPLYTPPSGSTVYILGAGIAAVTNKYMPDASFVHEAATGSMEIIRRMMQREANKKPAFALFGTPDGFRAYKGLGEYASKPFSTLRAICFINSSDEYFSVPAKGPIKSFADAKGKRIGIGGPGSMVSTSALLFFEAHGVTKNDFKPYYYVFNEVVEGIQNGSLDGGFLGGSYPMPSYMELSQLTPARVVPVDEQAFNKVLPEHPYYYKRVIKAKSYKGMDQDTPIYGFATSIFTFADVSENFVYRFLKNLWEHRQDYYAIHASAASDFTLESMTKATPVPFHPGAERYLKEIGAWKK